MRRLFAALVALSSVAAGQKVIYPAAKDGGNYMHNYYLPPAPGSYPWHPEWSPDGRSLAVSLLGSLWKVDAQTGDAVQLTSDRRYHSSPDWSPDGKWIIYTSDEDNRRIQLAILNVATGESRPLTDDNHVYLDPVFSPDGGRVAYVSTQPDGHFNVYVRAIRDGAWSGPPSPVSADHQYKNNRLYLGQWDLHAQPAWTPDGKSLLLLSNRGVPLGSGHVWRVPAVESGMSQASAVLTEQSLYRARPDVSPDGKRFLYASTGGASDQFNHLYVLPTVGGAPYKLTFGDHDDFHPRWSPDGERIAYISNEGGLPKLVVMDTYGGGRRTLRIRPVTWKARMREFRISVVDEQGRPAHARVHLTAADGKFYAPLDAYSRMTVTGQHFFHTSGDAAVFVPEGPLKVTAVQGFEMWPVRAEAVAGPNGGSVRLVLRRVWDSTGWHSGSTHVHMNYGGNLRNTLENLMFMSRAEGQDVVNELVANKDNRILDWMYFEPGGGAHSKSRPDMLLMVGQEYRPPFYGHTFFLGLKEYLISPFTTGYEGTGIESLYPSNTDMFRKARVQGAVTGYVHPWPSDTDPLEHDLGVGKGFPVDLALGVVDAYEWSNSSRGQTQVWHHALNNDLSVTPTGGEDSISNMHISKPPGSLRTYGWFGDAPLTAAAWMNAIRKGRTFFTGGPLLSFEVAGKRPGESMKLQSPGKVRVRARVFSVVPVNKVVIYRNGQEWKQLPVDSAYWQAGPSRKPCAEMDEEVEVDGSAWYTLYAEGPYSDILDVRFPQAETNAVRVYVGDEKIRNRTSAGYFIRWIDKLEKMADEWPWWRTDQEREHVRRQFNEARDVYRRLAAEARE